MSDQSSHPAGERKTTALVPSPGPVAVDTFGGRVHVECNSQAAVTPLGQLPFFTEFLQVSALFDPWLQGHLDYVSAPLLAEPLDPRYGRDRQAAVRASGGRGRRLQPAQTRTSIAYLPYLLHRQSAPQLRRAHREAIINEYAVLVTSLTDEILTVAQLYRDRADCENPFDELKNHWGWGGFTTRDLTRCRFMARITALVYNWWSLFVRLADPRQHSEAITRRPLLLHAPP